MSIDIAGGNRLERYNPEIYHPMFMEEFRDKLFMNRLCNRDYEGEIKKGRREGVAAQACRRRLRSVTAREWFCRMWSLRRKPTRSPSTVPVHGRSLLMCSTKS